MRPHYLIACVSSLALVAFVGGPMVAAHASGKKSQSHHEDNDQGNDENHGKHLGQQKGGANDFALFDGSNPLNQPNAGAVCGAKEGQPYTYNIAVANYGSDGFIRVTYADGDWVQYPIAAGGSFSLSQAGGSKGGDDRAVRVSNGGSAAQLAGVMSAQNGQCASCDADGGIGDAGCDAFVPN